MDITPVTISHATEQFAADLRGLNNLATGTINNYVGTCRQLAWFIEGRNIPRVAMTTDVTAELIEAYFRDHVAVHAAASYAQRRSNATAFVRWLMRRRYIEPGLNFVEDLPARKKTAKRKRNRYLSDSEFLRLLACAKRTHLRNYYLALFVRLTGRRIGEIVGDARDQTPLVWADIRWDQDAIEWDNSKGRKFGRSMPLTPRIRAVLEAWREVYCREIGVEVPHASWYIFPALTPTGRALPGRKRRGILAPRHRMTNPDHALRPILEEAGLREGNGDNWHMLRHAFGNQRKQAATEQNRGDAWQIAQIALDHQDEKTTRIYVDDQEDYRRYAEWANATPELSTDAMAKIPELAGCVPAPQTPKAATTRDQDDAMSVDRSDAVASEFPTNVVPLSSRRRKVALG